MNKYRWVVKDDPNDALASEIARTLGLSPAAARLCASRDFADCAAVGAYLDPSLDHAHDPFLFARMRDAVALVERALSEKRAILVGNVAKLYKLAVPAEVGA